MSDEPRDYAAERLAARSAKYAAEVARLRQLARMTTTDRTTDRREVAAEQQEEPSE